MHIPDPLSALAVPDELRGNRTIQFFAGLLPLLMVGVMCVAFMPRPGGAWLFGAATMTGVGLGGWLARRVPAPVTAPGAARLQEAPPRSGTASVAAEFVRGCADVVLVLELRPPGETTSQDASDFLSPVQPFSESQADTSLRLERRGVAGTTKGQPSCWTLLAHADDVSARYVHVPVGDAAGQTQQMTRLLRRLRVSKRALRDVLRLLVTGRSVFTGPLKAVVLCCSLTDVRKQLDTMVSTTGRELEAIGRSLGGRFPIYIVATDLQHVTGFAEFAAALKSRRGAASLDEAFGIALDREERNKDGLHRRLFDLTSEVAAWRPSLLAAIDEQARRDARYQPSCDRAAAKALTYEFPRQLAMASAAFADFCWRAVAVAQGSGRGPVLRGVFFTGLVMPEIDPFIGSLVVPAPFHRRAFAWNLLTRHIAGSPAEDAARAS